MSRHRGLHAAFTLAELMIVITIITIMASVTLVAMYGVLDQAKEARTQAEIAKLHEIIMEKWEAYRTRAVPLDISFYNVPKDAVSPTAAQLVGMARLRALRELMRMELPERKTDLNGIVVSATAATATSPLQFQYSNGSIMKPWPTNPISMSAPALWHAYRRRAGYSRFNPSMAATWSAPATWTDNNQYAECLYLIVANTMYGEDSALKFFKESEIGDVDGDGMKEILDAWGHPIYFLRWAPGFTYTWGADGKWGVATVDDDGNGSVDDPIPSAPNQPVILERAAAGSDDELMSEAQVPNGLLYPDPFDPLQTDPRWRNAHKGDEPFALVPLIFSAGRDGVYGLWDDQSATFNHAKFGNDPYLVSTDTATNNPVQIGMPYEDGSRDNITNHLLGAK